MPTALLESAVGREWPLKSFHDQILTNIDVAGREDRTRDLPHTRWTRIRPHYKMTDKIEIKMYACIKNDAIHSVCCP